MFVYVVQTKRLNMDSVLASLQTSFVAAVNNLADVFTRHTATIKAKLRIATAADSAELLARWHESLSEPAGEHASYGKSFARITGRPITMYDIVSYRDAECIITSGTLQELTGIELEVVDVPTGAMLAKMWSAVDILCATAYAHETMESFGVVNIPTRDEIAAEIKEHKRRKKTATAPGSTGGLSMDDARRATLTASLHQLFTGCQQDPPKDIDIDAIDAAMLEKAGPSGTYGDAAASGNLELLSQCPALKAFGLPPVTQDNTKHWQELAAAFGKSYSLVKMQKTLPSGMMAKIEEQAAQLASQGDNLDMSSLDLGQIGESVLQSCSPTDLSQMVGNMQEIIPTLNGLASSLQHDVNSGTVPPDVAKVLAGVGNLTK
jgi:hypothetical protein